LAAFETSEVLISDSRVSDTLKDAIPSPLMSVEHLSAQPVAELYRSEWGRIWKEVIAVQLSICAGIYVERLGKSRIADVLARSRM
jgi:hypothetical protein